MYDRILLPLDGSRESEEVLNLVRGEVTPEGELILLQVIPPAKTQHVGGHIILGSQQEDTDRHEANGYLRTVVRLHGGDPRRWRCEVAVSDSVAEGIAAIAGREQVDLIAMYTHDRNLLARHVKKSVARDVQRQASTEVRVFGVGELSGYVHGETEVDAKPGLESSLLKQIDVFSNLSDQQIQRLVEIGHQLHIPAGDKMGEGGATGQFLYAILEGEAHLTIHSDVGEISVRIARPGEAFPLATLLGSGTLITSGEALTDVEALVIPRSELLLECTKDPEMGMRIYSAVGRLFSNRYADTLTQLAISVEREMRESNA